MWSTDVDIRGLMRRSLDPTGGWKAPSAITHARISCVTGTSQATSACSSSSDALLWMGGSPGVDIIPTASGTGTTTNTTSLISLDQSRSLSSYFPSPRSTNSTTTTTTPLPKSTTTSPHFQTQPSTSSPSLVSHTTPIFSFTTPPQLWVWQPISFVKESVQNARAALLLLKSQSQITMTLHAHLSLLKIKSLTCVVMGEMLVVITRNFLYPILTCLPIRTIQKIRIILRGKLGKIKL